MLLGKARCLFVTFLLFGPGAMGQENTQSCVLKGSNTGSPPPQVTDLEVNVTDSMLGDKRLVTLTCSTTCRLTDNPFYIWYKSGEIIHQDSDPWYQYPVTSEDAGSNYSCAVKGHEASRSPAVSVEATSPNCLKVTYAGGRHCPENQPPDKTCSFTYPRELWVNATKEGMPVTLTCNTGCYPTGTTTPTYTWYKSKDQQTEKTSQLSVTIPSTESYSCSLAGREERSPSVCVKDKNCWSTNYVTKRICAVRGSSVNMSCSYTFPTSPRIENTFWYTTWIDGKTQPEELNLDGGRFKYIYSTENLHTLRVTGLEERDSAEYKFRFTTNVPGGKYAGIPGVNLHVTGLQVKVTPPTVTEGQSVTLTCSTTCFLPGDLTYIWYKNRQVLTQVEAQQKNLHLNQVSSEDDGSSYSCAIKGHDDITSSNKTLTVRYAPKKPSVSVSPSGEIVEGSSVTLTCSSDANPPGVNYTWYKENRASIISSGPSYTISNFTSEYAGYYVCEAKNEVGFTNSSRLISTAGKFASDKIVWIAGLTVSLLILLLITIALFSKKHKSSSEPANSRQSQQAPANMPTIHTMAQNGRQDASLQDASLQDASLQDASLQDASLQDASLQDASLPDASIHYASINFSRPKTQEGPASSTIHKQQPQEEEIHYASVNFNRPSAAPSVNAEDPSALYSRVRRGV